VTRPSRAVPGDQSHRERHRLRTAQVTAARERLIKLGAWFKTSTRRIVIHLPDTAPWRDEWVTIAGRLAAPQA